MMNSWFSVSLRPQPSSILEHPHRRLDLVGRIPRKPGEPLALDRLSPAIGPVPAYLLAHPETWFKLTSRSPVMVGEKKSYLISSFSPKTALGQSMARFKAYCASFLLIPDRFSGLARTRIVSPSALYCSDKTRIRDRISARIF